MIAFTLIALSAAGAPAAHSQPGKPLFGLRPSLYGKTTLEEGHFQYAVKAGSAVQDAVEVINLTDEQLELSLYAADMEQTKEGAFSPKDEAQKMTKVGTWLELERKKITLPPKGKRYVSFAVKVPPGLRPGDHVGAVVGSNTTQAPPGGLNIESRVALIARIRIPGRPILDAEIGPLRVTEGRTFTVQLRNTGNLLFTAKGAIDVSSGGRRTTTLRLQPPDVYLIPGGRASFRATWDNPPLFGDRVAVASFDTTSPKEPFERLSGAAIPLRFFSRGVVLLALLIVGGLVLAVFVMQRRTATPRSPKPDAMNGASSANMEVR